MSMLRSVLTYMGLGPDEDYDDGYLYEVENSTEEKGLERRELDDLEIDVRDPDPHLQRRRPDWLDSSSGAGPSRRSGRRQAPVDENSDSYSATSSRGRHDVDRQDAARPLRAVTWAEFEGTADGATVRPKTVDPDIGPRQVKPYAISPQSFGDAKVLADEFKKMVPVIMNLQGVERDLARRLIDFASGICYALDGGMEKVASQVFLLTPDSVEISEEDRRRLEQRGYE